MGFHRRSINVDLIRSEYLRLGYEGIDRLFKKGRYDVLSLSDAKSVKIHDIFLSYFDSELDKCKHIHKILFDEINEI